MLRNVHIKLSPGASLLLNTSLTAQKTNIFFFFLRFYLFIFRQRGREGESEGEKSQCVVASHAPPTGDLAFNPGICPHWESNWQPFGSQACAHSTEPHLPGQKTSIFKALQRRRLLRDPGVIVATCSQVLIIHLSPVGAPHFPQ